jgi:hypothetical protein
MIASANAFLPSTEPPPSQISQAESLETSLSSLTDPATINQTVAQVASTVVSASGWMASTLTSLFLH